MNPQKQFTGFLSSVGSPGDLSGTIQSLTKAILSAAALFAVVKGLDSATIVNNVQNIIDVTTTGVAAGLTIYHSIMTVWGLAHKLYYQLFAKPVITVPTAVPTAVVSGPSAIG